MTADYALIQEMREVPGLLRRFDPHCIKPWLDALQANQKIMLTGEGSSRIFPAHNMIDQALRCHYPWHLYTCGARQALDYALTGWAVIGASNSGKTRELVALFTHLKDQAIARFAVTGQANSRISELADHAVTLTCGLELATAASKSVIEQALIFQALLQGNEWQHKGQAADLCQAILAQPVPDHIIATLSTASCLYFAGRNNGVAEELTLKAYEIARTRSDYLEGTYLFHGVEEIMTEQDALIIIEPAEADYAKIQSVAVDGIGLPVIVIASHDTPFPTITVPTLSGFDNYFQLLAGWQLLVAIGLANNVDLDHTKRARKMGNAV